MSVSKLVRLIPARAGKTHASHCSEAHLRAHPRACGENVPVARARPRGHGSSPRVRGKPTNVITVSMCGRLIPARAGKTHASSGAENRAWAHPRACGENGRGGAVGAFPQGSSPRVRGKLRKLSVSIRRRRRLIPARAGKTSGRPARRTTARAHPRACGENGSRRRGGFRRGGSSPRVRGKRRQIARDVLDGRLIPARAGKTVVVPTDYSDAAAHPRACGENVTLPMGRSSPSGSSPRVRGKQQDRHYRALE